VQGATEFLPVSSSGHLFLVETWLGLVPDIDLMIATHVATLGAVLLVFWRQAWELVQGFFYLIFKVIGLGLVQGIAVVPGLSRSGLTIAFLILVGLNRRRSAELSFLLSIPTILAAGIFLIIDSGGSVLLSTELLLACVAAFLTALVMIYSMLKLVEKHWIWFAPYCLCLGIYLLIFT